MTESGLQRTKAYTERSVRSSRKKHTNKFEHSQETYEHVRTSARERSDGRNEAALLSRMRACLALDARLTVERSFV